MESFFGLHTPSSVFYYTDLITQTDFKSFKSAISPLYEGIYFRHFLHSGHVFSMKPRYLLVQYPDRAQLEQYLELEFDSHFFKTGLVEQTPQDFLQFVLTHVVTDTLQSLSLAKVGHSVYLSVHAVEKSKVQLETTCSLIPFHLLSFIQSLRFFNLGKLRHYNEVFYLVSKK